MIKTKKIVISIILLVSTILIYFCSSTSVFADNIEVMASAKGMAVMEGNTNTLLYSHNADLKLPMASLTKIITAIVAIENCDDINKEIVVSDNAIGIEGTSIYLDKSEKISIKNLLYGLMLASGNDCSVALAEEIGGDTASFVEMMNNFVANINATSTHVSNPHGLDQSNHYTTASDLALITSYALKNPIFRQIVGTKYYTIPATNTHDIRYLKHKNKLLFYDNNCIGIKTGFTDNAGRCLVNAVEKDGMQIVSVVLNCPNMFEECAKLTDMALDEYKLVEWVKPYSYVGKVNVTDGNVKELGVVTIKGYIIPVKVSELEDYEVEYNIPNSIAAPLDSNSVVGDVVVTKDGKEVFKENLYTIDAVKNMSIRFMIDNIIENWF